MDLNKEMLSFTDWLETNPLEPSAQTLWVHLMMLANKSGYPEWFAVANPLLQVKVSISENTLIKRRLDLINKGRIEYKSMGKQKAGKYRIIPFTSKYEVSNEANREVNHAVRGEVKGSASLKDSSFSISDSGYESFYSAHKRLFGFECNPGQANQLGVYIDQDGLTEALVIHALSKACSESVGYSFKFIKSVLDRYALSGVKTVEEAKQLDANFEARKNNSQPDRRPPGGSPRKKELEDLRRRAEEERNREQIGSA